MKCQRLNSQNVNYLNYQEDKQIQRGHLRLKQEVDNQELLKHKISICQERFDEATQHIKTLEEKPEDQDREFFKVLKEFREQDYMKDVNEELATYLKHEYQKELHNRNTAMVEQNVLVTEQGAKEAKSKYLKDEF